ncbi:hypothetical protein Tco_0837648 [Tanacetum coccineum]
MKQRKTVALEEINSIEKRIDEGSAMPSDNDHRLILLQEIEKIDKFASMDIIQKGYVNGDLARGYEKFLKFFHGIVGIEKLLKDRLPLVVIKKAVWDLWEVVKLGPGDVPLITVVFPIGSQYEVLLTSWKTLVDRFIMRFPLGKLIYVELGVVAESYKVVLGYVAIVATRYFDFGKIFGLARGSLFTRYNRALSFDPRQSKWKDYLYLESWSVNGLDQIIILPNLVHTTTWDIENNTPEGQCVYVEAFMDPDSLHRLKSLFAWVWIVPAILSFLAMPCEL